MYIYILHLDIIHIQFMARLHFFLIFSGDVEPWSRLRCPMTIRRRSNTVMASAPVSCTRRRCLSCELMKHRKCD